MNEFSMNFIVKEEHIDVQQIMDGLYYPFYMEICRHAYIKEVLGFDFEQEAVNGVNMVLSQYTIKFIRSLKKGDEFEVTCQAYADAGGQTKLHFKQSIVMNKKQMTVGVFSGTCVPANGGRPFLPEKLRDQLGGFPVLDPAHQ